jgi:DNA polymerase III alpha subunit
VLWIDGSISVAPENVLTAIADGVSLSKLFVTSMTPEIEQYNRFSDTVVVVKTEIEPPSVVWNIPEKYKVMDVHSYIINDVLPEQIEQSWSDQEISSRIERVLHELQLYEQHNAMDVLRVLIYIVNTLNESDVIWGVGRGSSVASYVLYLIGVHDIDSVQYQLEITDFLR